MEKGQIGQKYILGNQNLPLIEIFQILSRLTGIPVPRQRMLYPIAFAFAAASTAYANWISKKPPLISVESVRLTRKYMYFDSSRAIRELGFQPGSVEKALEKAVCWFREHHDAESPFDKLQKVTELLS
jgi:dihydroflavonol-4-reductase